MEEIYRKVPFERTLRFKSGAKFMDTPAVVLYYERSKKYFDATVDTVGQDGSETVTFSFTAAQTDAMMEGIYRIEVYADDSKDELLWYNNEFARVITVSVSSGQDSGDPTE